jgi:hypothetical protein
MIRVQIRLPDELYREAKRAARERELSFAEVVRRGLEYLTRVYPPTRGRADAWSPPAPRRMGGFTAAVVDWRELAQGEPDRRLSTSRR